MFHVKHFFSPFSGQNAKATLPGQALLVSDEDMTPVPLFACLPRRPLTNSST
jgi:hypothetical protein